MPFVRWRPAATYTRQQLPAATRRWLVCPGSLTRRLQAQSRQYFHVDHLGSHWSKPLPDEARLLALPLDAFAYQREVRLCDGEQAMVYARTVVPVVSYRSLRHQLESMGNRSLGELLFTDPSVQRGTIEIACLNADHPLYQQAIKHTEQRPESLWARRSCFWLSGKLILVNEIFLPAVNRHA